MNKKTMKFLLCLALLAALSLICVLFFHYRDLGYSFQDTQAQLSASRNTWETTAAEKEALQEDLKTLKNELKEAKLSLQEAQERSETLKADIETLNQEILELRSKLPDAD